VGFVVIALIRRNDKPSTRLGAITLLLVFSGGLVGAASYFVRPTSLPPSSNAEAQSDTPSVQPPESTPPAATATPTAPSTSTTVQQAQVRTDCGTAWTGWIDLGGGVGNPCPLGCTRGAELGQSLRVVGVLRAQIKHKFQCWRG
jgi:hypothetical protein